MRNAPLYLYALLLAWSLSSCSTTEEQVENLIEELAANPIDSDAWRQSVDRLAALGRPAARQLIAHIDPGYYKGENYREYRDEIEKIRTGCARALGRIQYHAAAATLKDRLGSAYTDSERRACIWALGELGFDQAGLEALEKQLQDEDPAIRLLAAVALIKMGDARGAGEIEQAIEGPDAALAQQALAQMRQSNYFGTRILVELSQREGPRQQSVREVLDYVQAQLIAQLQDEDPQLRMHSARALGRIGARDARRPLRALLEDTSNLVRFSAATSLAEMDQAAGVDFLFSALRNQDPILRVNAVHFLTEVQQHSGAVEAKLIAALKSEDPLSRSGAAQVLGQARVAGAVEALLAATADETPQVRWSAIIALGRIGASQSRERLEQLLQDRDHTVSYYAGWALRQLGRG